MTWREKEANGGVWTLNYIHLLKFIYEWNGDEIIGVGIKPSVSLAKDKTYYGAKENLMSLVIEANLV